MVASAPAHEILDEADRLRQGASTARPLFDVIEAALKAPDKGDVISSGIGPLDSLLGTGLRRGELVTVAARPSHGKTAFGLAVAANVIRRGVRVAFASMEMTGESLLQRLICAEAGEPLATLRAGTATEPMHAAAVRLAERPLNVLDDVRHVGPIVRHLRRAPDTGLVVIDYAQLLDAGAQARRYGSREQEIASITRGVKQIATHFGVAVLMLSQLNREIERRGDQRPRLADLRESGSLEQDSDIVIGLYRPSMAPGAEDDPAGVDPCRLNAEVLKNRQGPTGRVRLHFDTSTQRLHAEEDAEPLLRPVS